MVKAVIWENQRRWALIDVIGRESAFLRESPDYLRSKPVGN
jgi:hypothetical protein